MQAELFTAKKEWRALSLTGPWWWFMLHLPPEYRKEIENRSPGFSHKSFRGDFLFHAAKGMTVQEYNSAMKLANSLGVPPSVLDTVPLFSDMPRGGIVGRGRVVDLVPPGESGRRWHFADSFGFVVEDATPLPFVPCVGALGFWKVKPETLAELRAKGATL